MNISSSLNSAVSELSSHYTPSPGPGSAATSKSGMPLVSASSASGSVSKVAAEAVEAQAGLLGIA
jgi:hypothetical protein